MKRSRDVIAKTAIEWIEWNVEDLRSIMEAEKTVQASFYSILYGEILETLKDGEDQKRTGEYKQVLAACLADGKLYENQRRLLEDSRQRLRISDEEHASMLSDLGWDHDAWLRGVLQPTKATDTVAQLEKAVAIMNETIRSIRQNAS